jgi:hypothetical protein
LFVSGAARDCSVPNTTYRPSLLIEGQKPSMWEVTCAPFAWKLSRVVWPV